MKLEKIGFYTLSDHRALTVSPVTPLQRCELLLTDRCNFKCPYCRGMREDCRGDLSYHDASRTIDLWLNDNLRNIRFSGGEPTLWPGLKDLVRRCRVGGVNRIALSTNGSASIDLYKKLIDAGVNDFSISLDGGCCSTGEIMCGGLTGMWEHVVKNIEALSCLSYTTVGMVFTEQNIDTCIDDVIFAHNLGVSDIRVIPSAQYNQALCKFTLLPQDILDKHPILNYRIQNTINNKHVRGIKNTENMKHCWLAMDDVAVAGKWHFPCIIYLREYGNPIGEIGPNMRKDRIKWLLNHNPKTDSICKNMCLDVCVDYCNKAEETHANLSVQML